MRTITSAPQNKTAWERYGYLLNVAKTGVAIGLAINILTEAVPLYTIMNNTVTQHIAHLLGEMAEPLTVAATLLILYTLSRESVSSARAAFGTLKTEQVNGGKSFTTMRELGIVATAVIWLFFLFVILSKTVLTVIGTHQIADAAIQAPIIERLVNEPATTEDNTAIKPAVNAQNAAVAAAKSAAASSEAALTRKIKAAKTQYSKDRLKKELTQLRDENAAKVKEAEAVAAARIAELTAVMQRQNNVKDSINNANSGVIVTLQKTQVDRYIWVTAKMQKLFPLISVLSILFVAACVYVLVVVEDRCGIQHMQVPDKFEYLPSLISVYSQAAKNLIEGHMRALAAKIKYPNIVGETGEIHAGAAGISQSINPQINISPQQATITMPETNIAPPAPATITPPPVLNEEEDEKNPLAENPQVGTEITLNQAYMRRNTYQNFIDKKMQGRNLVTAAARVKYYNHIIDHMVKNKLDKMIEPPFLIADWK